MAIEYEQILKSIDPETGKEIEIYPTVKVDDTLSVSGKPADSAAVGKKLTELQESAGKKAIEIPWAEYEAKEAAGEIEEDVPYYIPDAGGSGNGGGGNSNVRELTYAEYLDLGESVADDDITYFIKDLEPSGGDSAADISYDNSVSGLESTDTQGAIDELKNTITDIKDSFSTAANDIGDAIAAVGVTVPDGTSLSDMAGLITANLYRVIDVQTASMSRTTTGEFNLTADATIVPYNSASISGNAIQYSNNGILVKAPIKTAKITVRSAAVNTMSTGVYAVYNVIRVNGVTVKSSSYNVQGKTLTEGTLEHTLTDLKEGDLITHYIYRGTLSSGFSVYKEAYMNCTFTK